MPIARRSLTPYTCPYCLWTPRSTRTSFNSPSSISVGRRSLTTSPRLWGNASTLSKEAENSHEDGRGAMSRRLSQMSEESLETGGSSAQKAVEEAGFDEDLKTKLLERLADANFKNENASAFAQSDLPLSAGGGTRDIAGARAWDGTESVEDAALRMLNDAHKPLKGAPPPKTSPIRIPTRIDAGRSRNRPSSGARIAHAKDRTSIYASMKDADITDREREQYKKEMKDRFTPSARSVPATIAGLNNLANQRIEEAIARGQFKNLPRGKKIERSRAGAHLDTTQRLLNDIIQRQEIVPPWIEKQQEIVTSAARFRARLRNDWKRHAARMIAATGGTLADQIRRAEAYAVAEAIDNPPKRKKEAFNAVDEEGHMSQITLAGELKATTEDATAATAASEYVIQIKEEPVSNENPSLDQSQPTTVVSPSAGEDTPTTPPSTNRTPYRDPTWLKTEHSYLTLTIQTLNSLTRSYNLIAPQLAQKPYSNLERELKSCYADVAPLLADEIRERASKPRVKVELVGTKAGGILDKAFERSSTRVYDENLQVKGYGFRQFWKDLWGRGVV
ncbi:hypothetical protein EJ08DRAFT_619020 [Tothia fuscella]|uniref:DnaJ homologue subfamily C member 28 conserved domain-containing protein n=1 Tax=Tothia fuscella TaxID=1048955 RepID=A0A9P4TTN1_9PEZI|nr:hypothetical protein EJ08DRAFT_619020 [Tothia fuscella]